MDKDLDIITMMMGSTIQMIADHKDSKNSMKDNNGAKNKDD